MSKQTNANTLEYSQRAQLANYESKLYMQIHVFVFFMSRKF